MANYKTNCNISSCNWYGAVKLLSHHIQRCHEHQFKEIMYKEHVKFNFEDIYTEESFFLYDIDRCYWLKFQKFEDSIEAGIYKIGRGENPDKYYMKFGSYRKNGLTGFFGPYTTKSEHSREFDMELSYDTLRKFEKLSPTVMIYFIMNSAISSTSDHDIDKSRTDVNDNSDYYSSETELEDESPGNELEFGNDQPQNGLSENQSEQSNNGNHTEFVSRNESEGVNNSSEYGSESETDSNESFSSDSLEQYNENTLENLYDNSLSFSCDSLEQYYEDSHSSISQDLLYDDTFSLSLEQYFHNALTNGNELSNQDYSDNFSYDDHEGFYENSNSSISQEFPYDETLSLSLEQEYFGTSSLNNSQEHQDYNNEGFEDNFQIIVIEIYDE